ncbi:aldehyde dehydrogenase [Diplocarpon mali]|nr:aldehyde dehydrogenase [Diplocarpon mali]
MAPSADSVSAAAMSSSQYDFTTFRNVISGNLVTASETRHAINPATKEPSWEVPIATAQDVDEAVAAARRAFPPWAETPIEQRQHALKSFAAALAKHTSEFAKLLVIEQGKPLNWASYEAQLAPKKILELADMSVPDETLEDNEDRHVVARFPPLGVVVGIVAWNFPLILAVGKIIPAVLTGNTVIVKPSPFTPYTALKLVEIAQSFFPPGVVQALGGDETLGPLLTAHAGVDKITFTGSSATGKKIMESASKTLKRVTLELGGNDPAIVCKSVDIPSTAAKVAAMAFMNSGQVCVALKRIYIHDSIYPAFRDAMVAYTQTLKVGPGFEDGVAIGPVQNAMQYERVKGFLDDAAEHSQVVALGGDIPASEGYFISPTIIENPADDSRVVMEEPFGPVLPIMRWCDEEDVVRRANDTRMGLGASVWSRDLDEAARIALRIQAGSVWVNTHMEVSSSLPFGGLKESGLGVENGIVGLKAFCNMQVLFLKKKI